MLIPRWPVECSKRVSHLERGQSSCLLGCQSSPDASTVAGNEHAFHRGVAPLVEDRLETLLIVVPDVIATDEARQLGVGDHALMQKDIGSIQGVFASTGSEADPLGLFRAFDPDIFGIAVEANAPAPKGLHHGDALAQVAAAERFRQMSHGLEVAARGNRLDNPFDRASSSQELLREEEKKGAMSDKDRIASWDDAAALQENLRSAHGHDARQCPAG